MFDRAWWGLGSRKADPAYDVFACALLGAHVLGLVSKADVERLGQRAPLERRAWLLAQLNTRRQETPFVATLYEAAIGHYADTRSFIQEVAKVLEDNPLVASAVQASAVAPSPVRQPVKRVRPWDGTDWALLIAIVVFAVTLIVLIWL